MKNWKKVLLLLIVSLGFVHATFARKEKHPGLFFTNERIQQLKQRIQTDTVISNAWEDILNKANVLLDKNDFRKSDYLSLAYLMTGDEKYAAKVKELLLKQTGRTTWAVGEMMERQPAWNSELQMAHDSYSAALAYDAIYTYLTPGERKQMAKDLVSLAIEPALGDWLLEPTRIHSLNSMGHNWWTSCVCMAGVLSMAIADEEPRVKEWIDYINKILPQWFAFNGDVLQFKPKSFDAKGGMYESLNYASFGISEALLFRLGWINTHPGQNAPEIPELKYIPNFFMHVCYPRTGILYGLNFGDSHKNIAAESCIKLLYAMGIGDKNSLWYLNQVVSGQHRDGMFLNTPMGLLYQPHTEKAPLAAEYPTSELFADFGWGTMRDSWKKDATMLAVKSGFTWNHSHADANSFILFHKGVDIIKDAGNCWYGASQYPAYFFQSQAHNVVLFNGEGQMTEQQYGGSPLRGYLHHLLDAGEIKYILADGTGPVSQNFSRNFRHFLWMNKIIYIIDDLKTHKPGSFEWLWHPNGEVKKTGMDLSVINGSSSVLIRPLYPETLIKTGFNHDFPEKMKITPVEGPKEDDVRQNETYYSFSYPEQVRRIKGVTAIILKDSVNDADIPRIEKIRGEEWIGLRVKHGRKITELYLNQLADGRLMHLNSCINVNGWETDAYLFVVSYEEGTDPAEANDLFIGYGSYLRREGNTHYSSLSKLFAIQQQVGSEIKLTIDGQPLIDASFRSKKKPANLQLNGKNVPVNYESGLIKVSYRTKKEH